MRQGLGSEIPGAFFMRFDRLLLRANLFGLALLLILLIGMIGYGMLYDYIRDDGYGRYGAPKVPEGAPRGEKLEGPDGPLTLYYLESDDPEARRDVRIVDMKTGKIVRLAPAADALIYGEEEVGQKGYAGLVRTGEQDGRPRFDVVFVRYSDMTRHVLASGVDAMDNLTDLDDASFSAVIWDSLQKGRFVIVDVPSVRIVVAHPLDFADSERARKRRTAFSAGDAVNAAAADAAAAAEDAAFEAAPVNKFH